MSVTPSQLFDLALFRHRQPWNWSLHFAALVLFCLTLLGHSYLLLAASLILLGAGFFDLKLGDPPGNLWFGFVKRGVEREKNWASLPWNWAKWLWLLITLCLALAVIWVLWTRELAGLGLLAGFGALAWAAGQNRANNEGP